MSDVKVEQKKTDVLKAREDNQFEVRNFFVNGMADAFEQIEAKDLSVKRVEVNINTYRFLKKYLADDMGFVTDENELKTGHVGMLWCAEVYLVDTMSDDVVALIS